MRDETVWEAPAKLNLWLRVGRVDADGLHPIDSLVQTVDWLDVISVALAEEDRLDVDGAELPEGGDNLIWRAVEKLLGGRDRPGLSVELVKRIAVAAGVGGGSADAAAMLRAVALLLRRPGSEVEVAAPRVGSDVPYLLLGGTASMQGHGELIRRRPALSGFTVVVAVPPYELSTPDVYRAWDALGEPTGPEIPDGRLPPAMRGMGPLVNDLTPAAWALRPDLREWMADLSSAWGRPVALSGSGPACFGFFADLDEADAAAAECPVETRSVAAAGLRPEGVKERPR